MESNPIIQRLSVLEAGLILLLSDFDNLLAFLKTLQMPANSPQARRERCVEAILDKEWL